MRRVLCLMIALSAGCLQMQRLSNWIDPPPEGKREPDMKAAARADQIGRQIMAANPFAGLDVTFQVIGHPDSLIFHRDHNGVFLSDTLVEQCKTDSELAALLCIELGQMVAEKRNLSRMGYMESKSQTPQPNGMESNPTSDPVRMAELALRKEEVTKDLTDPKKISLELLRTSGHDVAAMPDAEALFKKANTNHEVLRQLGGTAAEPTWTR